ncbi:hypothetical protein EYF80_053243 [Liparis tanakae]|uniref:Uncharacterized protein n=1 Tax=Liparis tanakae TaxID=230148 RepID=A0A4Z2F5S1_9TELE|nr:hypothetical protein EYF80_053243 [Liparis tanakae]
MAQSQRFTTPDLEDATKDLVLDLVLVLVLDLVLDLGKTDLGPSVTGDLAVTHCPPSASWSWRTSALWLIPAALWLIPAALWLIPAALWLIPAALWLIPVALWLIPVALWLIPAALWLIPVALWLIPAALWLIPAALWLIPAALWAPGGQHNADLANSSAITRGLRRRPPLSPHGNRTNKAADIKELRPSVQRDSGPQRQNWTLSGGPDGGLLVSVLSSKGAGFVNVTVLANEEMKFLLEDEALEGGGVRPVGSGPSVLRGRGPRGGACRGDDDAVFMEHGARLLTAASRTRHEGHEIDQRTEPPAGPVSSLWVRALQGRLASGGRGRVQGPGSGARGPGPGGPGVGSWRCVIWILLRGRWSSETQSHGLRLGRASTRPLSQGQRPPETSGPKGTAGPGPSRPMPKTGAERKGGEEERQRRLKTQRGGDASTNGSGGLWGLEAGRCASGYGPEHMRGVWGPQLSLTLKDRLSAAQQDVHLGRLRLSTSLTERLLLHAVKLLPHHKVPSEAS